MPPKTKAARLTAQGHPLPPDHPDATIEVTPKLTTEQRLLIARHTFLLAQVEMHAKIARGE